MVLTRMTAEEFRGALEALKTSAREWKSEGLEGMSLAIGYAFASEYEHSRTEELVREADLAMYDSKAEYYAQTGKERRRRTEHRERPADAPETAT